MNDSVTYPIRRSTGPALLILCIVIGCVACGLWLLMHSLTTGWFNRSTLGAVASLLISGVIARGSARDWLGQVTLDDHGVRIEPCWCGFSIDWVEIREWYVTDDRDPEDICLKFWRHSDDLPVVFLARWLSPSDFEKLIADVRACVGDQEAFGELPPAPKSQRRLATKQRAET